MILLSLLLFQSTPNWSLGHINQIHSALEKNISKAHWRAGGLVWFEERSYRKTEDGIACDIKSIYVVLRDDIHPMRKALHLSRMSGQSELQNVESWIHYAYGSKEFKGADQIIRVSMAEGDNVNFDVHKAILFPEARKGSIIVAQWTEFAKPFLGAISFATPSPVFPTKTFRCKAEGEGSKIQSSPTFNSKLKREGPWNILGNIHPDKDFKDSRPGFWVSFSDDSTPQYSDWNTYASWYHNVFKEAASAPPDGGRDVTHFKKVLSQLSTEVIYRQVYLDPSRGWVPEKGESVWQKGYGDCKDLVSAVCAKFPNEDQPILPVLANINGAPQVSSEDPSFPSFNHLIGAYKLTESLDAPAVFQTERGSVLLFDPTADQCEFGYLPAYYKNHRVLVCFPDGASWIDIPDTALEPSHFLIEISGSMQGKKMEGTLSIAAKGNPYGFRDVVDSQHQRLVHQFVRTIFKIPAHVKLSRLDSKEKLSFSVSWDEFLSKQGDRLFLPQEIVEPPLFGSEENPMPKPTMTWSIHLQNAPIKNRIEASWQDAEKRVKVLGSNNDLQYSINVEWNPTHEKYEPNLKDQEAFLNTSWRQ